MKRLTRIKAHYYYKDADGFLPDAFYIHYARRFVKQHWNIDLDVPIYFDDQNEQSKGEMGCFGGDFPKDSRLIDKSPSDYVAFIIIFKKSLLSYDNEPIFTLRPIAVNSPHMHMLEVLKHELCHYALFMQRRPFTDDAMEFIYECSRLNLLMNSNNTDMPEYRQWFRIHHPDETLPPFTDYELRVANYIRKSYRRPEWIEKIKSRWIA